MEIKKSEVSLSNTDRDKVEITNVRCVHTTAGAIKCIISGDEYWFPRSAIEYESEVFQKGDEGLLVVNRGIAEEKELYNG